MDKRGTTVSSRIIPRNFYLSSVARKHLTRRPPVVHVVRRGCAPEPQGDPDETIPAQQLPSTPREGKTCTGTRTRTPTRVRIGKVRKHTSKLAMHREKHATLAQPRRVRSSIPEHPEPESTENAPIHARAIQLSVETPRYHAHSPLCMTTTYMRPEAGGNQSSNLRVRPHARTPSGDR